VRNFNCYF